MPSSVPEDFQEIKAITLEWRLSNLKSIFEASRGEAKSRCIKSSLFGDGKWEIYFYANSVRSDYRIARDLGEKPPNAEASDHS